MKGAVFIALNEFVECQFGIAQWESILVEVQPLSRGIYTSIENYDDTELVAIVHALCKSQDLTRGQALIVFGEYLFNELNKKYPIFTSLHSNLFEFLSSVESIVHVEVKKLFKDAILPSIIPVEVTGSKIVIRYESSRKMCELAVGLINGAAKFYNQKIKIEQHACYHCGDDHCLIEVNAE